MTQAHPNIVRTYRKFDVSSDGKVEDILVIETDLDLDPLSSNYDVDAFDALVEVAKNANASGAYERVTIQSPQPGLLA